MTAAGRNETTLGGAAGREFLPTAWTQIRRARDAETTEARLAWDQLIGVYWKPVYFHIRRKGHSVEDAKDLTQGFFASLVERGSLRSVAPEKGRFRTFVCACLEHFLSDQYDRRDAAKRRPDIEVQEAEGNYSPQHDFERDWALTVLERAFLALRERAPREARVVAAQRSGATDYRTLAGEMDTTEANIKVLAHRGRKLLKELILRELRATVSDPGDERAELAELFRAVSL
jgi:RNA polymerase sigma-70 factor (ECF subfamily)